MIGPNARYIPNPPTNTAHRSVHPFAYNAQNTIPLSAVASELDFAKALEEQATPHDRPGGHSDILSRGAGPRLDNPTGERESGVSTAQGIESVGMGTFGRGASQDPVSSSEVSWIETVNVDCLGSSCPSPKISRKDIQNR